jgi:hypothetical protein
MNPEQTLETANDRFNLERLMQAFAAQKPAAEERRAALTTAGLGALHIPLGANASSFGTELAAELMARPVPARHGENHPLCLLLSYLLANPEQNGIFTEDDVAFLRTLVEQTLDRSRAVAARQSVGMIEDEAMTGFGTGVLVGAGLLLTCNHIFTKTVRPRAWVRFGFKVNFDGRSRAEGGRYELDVADPVERGGGMAPDFCLVRIVGVDPQRPRRTLARVRVNTGQPVRMIHHPQGRPAEVSEPGQIRHVDEAYLLHDVLADEGSSGAPIFSASWELIALHRGDTEHVNRPGTAEAVPVNAVLDRVAGRV